MAHRETRQTRLSDTNLLAALKQPLQQRRAAAAAQAAAPRKPAAPRQPPPLARRPVFHARSGAALSPVRQLATCALRFPDCVLDALVAELLDSGALVFCGAAPLPSAPPTRSDLVGERQGHCIVVNPLRLPLKTDSFTFGRHKVKPRRWRDEAGSYYLAVWPRLPGLKRFAELAPPGWDWPRQKAQRGKSAGGFQHVGFDVHRLFALARGYVTVYRAGVRFRVDVPAGEAHFAGTHHLPPLNVVYRSDGKEGRRAEAVNRRAEADAADIWSSPTLRNALIACHGCNDRGRMTCIRCAHLSLGDRSVNAYDAHNDAGTRGDGLASSQCDRPTRKRREEGMSTCPRVLKLAG